MVTKDEIVEKVLARAECVGRQHFRPHQVGAPGSGRRWPSSNDNPDSAWKRLSFRGGGCRSRSCTSRRSNGHPEQSVNRKALDCRLPFRPLAMTPELAILANAIPYEIIQALSRLRWLAVIARGSSFPVPQTRPGPRPCRNRTWCPLYPFGIIEANLSGLAVTLELSDASTNGVIWG